MTGSAKEDDVQQTPQSAAGTGEGGEGGKGAGSPQQEPQGEGGGTDTHGQPGINKERHDKEVAELNQQIEELKAEVAKAAETKEGREKLEKQIEELKADMADKDTSHKLEMAGCVDAKAAKARLGDFGGDVAKLKESCPYLFGEGKQKPAGSTGKPPAGASTGEDDRLDEIFGLKK